MKHNFEEHKQNRIDNAEKQAQKNKSLSEHFYVAAKKMASVIPLGQPILVGHHSEKSDRNYRNKIHNTFGKSFQAEEKANYYREKAETIKSNTSIFSDDPQALEKLRKQLDNLQASQEFMKDANRCLKKNDKDSFLKLRFGTEKLWEELSTPDYLNRIGFAHYSLSNNNANINRIKKRIEEMEKLASRKPQAVVFPGGQLRENQQAGRIQFIFDQKPGDVIRKMLKKHGFKWSPTENAWQRHYNANGIWAAKQALQQILEAAKNL